ncbi:MAG: hypothetical protein EBU82_08245, partial [Flavobacteriia bacterium]|nr:hypothetical protein [Flavobacteriia bacterium]
MVADKAFIKPFSTVSSTIADISSSISNLSNHVLVFFVSGFLKAGFKKSIQNLVDIIKNEVRFKANNKTSQVYGNKNLQAFMSAEGQKYFETYGNPNDALLEDEKFKGVVNNPIVKSFESTIGEGLAGTIQTFTLGFDQQIPWELDQGSRAPIAIKVGLGISVIHDILVDNFSRPKYATSNLCSQIYYACENGEIPFITIRFKQG